MPLMELVGTSERGNVELRMGPACGDRSSVGCPNAAGEGMIPSRIEPEEDCPPRCPACTRRLVILATQAWRDEHGVPARRQLWGCPFGHATVYRVRGAFGPVEVLEEIEDSDF